MRHALLASAAPVLALGLSAAVLAAGTADAAAETRQKFEFWYGLTGQLADVVQNQCKLFNSSQERYEAVCVGQGGYDKAEQNTIAAYRAHQQPTIVQIYDAGTVNFLLSGAIYQADKFDQDYHLNIDWNSYYPAIRDFYGTSQGTMWSFPYNSSTAVLYWNKDAWAKIGKTEAPKTWEDFGADLEALHKAGSDCAFAHDFDTWPILEQFSAINDVPVATEDNGFKGLDAKLVFNHTIFVDLLKQIKGWVDDGSAKIVTLQTGRSKDQAFADGSCASTLNSVADYSQIRALEKPGTIHWGVAELPVFKGHERHNSTIGGASLWVMAGKSKEEYEAAAAFIKYVTAPKTGEEYIVDNTGYIPVTTAGEKILDENGFYKDPRHAGREVAIQSLTASPVGPLTRGIRLGNFTAIRTIVRQELEAAFTGKADVQTAMDDAVAQGNEVLSRYAQTMRGKTLP